MYFTLVVVGLLVMVPIEVKGQTSNSTNNGPTCCPQLHEQFQEMEKKLSKSDEKIQELTEQVSELLDWKKKHSKETNIPPKDTCTSVRYPSEGYKVYYIAFLRNYVNAGYNSLMISAKKSTSVHVYSKQPSYDKTYNIKKNGFLSINDITRGAEVSLNATVTHQGILVNATEDVWVQGGNVHPATLDGFNAIHIGPDSIEYIIIVNHSKASNKVGFLVVGTQDETVVKIFKPVTSGGSELVIQTTVNKLETYAWYGPEVSGFKVISNKPIAVYAGDTCLPFGDHMVSSIPPIARLGKDYIVPPAPKSNSYILKVVSTAPNTEVTVFRDSVLYSRILHESQFYRWAITSTNEPLNVRCSSPCLVSQIHVRLVSRKDPYMMIITPNSALSQNIRFGTLIPYTHYHYFRDIYLTIISINQTTTFQLNDNPLQTDWYPIHGWNGGSYLYSTIKIQKGFYHLKSNDTSGGFAAYVQGFNNPYIWNEGFGYRLGLY